MLDHLHQYWTTLDQANQILLHIWSLPTTWRTNHQYQDISYHQTCQTRPTADLANNIKEICFGLQWHFAKKLQPVSKDHTSINVKGLLSVAIFLVIYIYRIYNYVHHDVPLEYPLSR